MDKIHFFHYELEKLNIYLTKPHSFDVGQFGCIYCVFVLTKEKLLARLEWIDLCIRCQTLSVQFFTFTIVN
ncbi:hypothetical protein T12_4680 [Trichinella patagoniensis]|uniref:Uncharacterized protein n=1 Tax=Trichinella patagoniensis TaxID=990121 RepID=A0A0V0ZQY8_9BILA|nr:hypothetical protein T12_4680 [Trichinella patagoniensis]